MGSGQELLLALDRAGTADHHGCGPADRGSADPHARAGHAGVALSEAVGPLRDGRGGGKAGGR